MSENKNTGNKLLGDIGEAIIAYELFKRGFSVAMNKLSGYDILAEKISIFLKIEVKTRYYRDKAGLPKKLLKFTITQNEMNICDVIICYIHGLNIFLIMPRNVVTKRTKSNKGLISITLRDKKITPHSQWKQYLDNWQFLDEILVRKTDNDLLLKG